MQYTVLSCHAVMWKMPVTSAHSSSRTVKALHKAASEYSP